MIWSVTGGMLAAGAGLLAWGVRGRSSNLLGPSRWRGSRHRRTLALTFDDGPSEATPALLELLDRFGVPATFFHCGANVERLPAVAGQVRRTGHEIGNHGYSHAPFYLRSPRFIEEEIGRAQKVLTEVTGKAPTLLRPPYGARWFGLERVQYRFGLMGVMWTTICNDWKLDTAGIAGRLLRGACNGGILCLHDGRELLPNPDIRPTLNALSRAIPKLLERGFRFETVSQILCPTKSCSE